MKKIISIISIVLIINGACRPIDNGRVEVSLRHEQKDSSHLLIMTVKNNTSTSIYIPRLASLLTPIDSIKFFNSKGEIINKQLINDELKYNILFYGPPIDRKVITDYCSNEPYLSDYIELDFAPFTKGKEMVRSIIQYEYESLILKYKPKMTTEEDIGFIKSMIFSKYSGAIFLKPKETYSDCITINTLFQSNETYKVFLYYSPNKELEKYNYKFKFGGDSLEITSVYLGKFKDFILYDDILTTDTLIIHSTKK